ncbi:MAG: hypothetical protein QOF42_2883, partial [Gammaproteobacteria bacterium]|nr:hypothetical protein [Gammaproteobacteria bacterium]
QLDSGRLFGMLDSKVNGKLDESELVGPIGSQFKASFAKIDTDHDGFIEPQELLAAQAASMKRQRAASQAPAAPAQPAAEKTGGGQ